MSNSPWSHTRSSSIADDVDFEIKGQELQFVEIELDPGESAVAEAGAMVWKDSDIAMSTVFGDGSANDGGGFMGKLLGAGKRLVTGESLFTTVFTHHGHGKARVAFAAPVPGSILPIKLDDVGGRLICQKDAFLCAARGVSIGIHFQQRIMTGLFGGEGFIMQK
uniref:AIM24 family protein n=1 Tax=Novosphingobium naphthalenivorans TaxID=273168 RepID=UPI000AF53B1F